MIARPRVAHLILLAAPTLLACGHGAGGSGGCVHGPFPSPDIYVSHGAGCDSAFGSLYSTDTFLGQGAWTIFLEDQGSTHVMCRDDGTANPLCVTH